VETRSQAPLTGHLCTSGEALSRSLRFLVGTGAYQGVGLQFHVDLWLLHRICVQECMAFPSRFSSFPAVRKAFVCEKSYD